MISRETRFTPASEATVKPMDDHGVIVDMRTGKCWDLNQVGFAIWTLAAEGKSVADTIAAISTRYAVSSETSETDVFAFLRTLVNAGLLVAAPGHAEDGTAG
jgi:hypothetical protein